MCGICGILAGNGHLISLSQLERMAATIRHRGPDDAGVWTGGDAEITVGFAHRRLSIIDLSPAGHQPMTNEDGSLWLVYNGEIYNHASIRRELQQRGHVYRSQTDSETILHAYEEWGDECVHRFRGMFAFAIWDGRRRRLLLARDRLGVKPLYYTERSGVLLFASEIKAILASGLVRPRPAPGAIPEYLMFGYLAGPGTLFDGIRKLPPGHLLTWEDGRVSLRQYWNVSFAVQSAASEAEQVRRFRELFEESVRLRLMSDVPLGVFLSGGLDSSAIAAVMSRHVSGPLETFSVGFEREHYSEFGFARRVAQHVGAKHHEVVLTAEGFKAALPRMVWHEDEPLWGPPSVALWAVAELASKAVKVVLTGEGSDELFAGYDRYWMNVWNTRALDWYGVLPAWIRRTVRAAIVDGILPARWRRALGHTFLNHDTMPDGLVLDNWFAVFTPAMQRDLLAERLLRELDDTAVRAAHRDIWAQADGRTIVDRMLYLDLKSNLVELLMKQDQMSMASSIESRVPFLDHKLVEFAATVPASRKVGIRTGKRLVKKALEGYLPHEILHRPKKGFPVPFESWLRRHYLGDVRALLLDARCADRGWVRPERVRALIEAHAAGRMNATRQIWSLWGLELWARIFLDDDRSWLEPVAADAHPSRIPAP